MSLFDDYDEDFPEAEMLTQDELKEVIEEENIVVKAYKRRKCGRKKLADNLERVPIYHDIPEEEKTCGCGAKLVKIGERYTEKLNIIPQGIATPGLLSYIFINKYCNHVPYYRQSKNFERKGIELSRATMDKWQLEVYEKLKPLEKIMLEYVKTGKVLNMDETTTQILHYENGNTERKKSYIWLAHGGPKNKQLAIYRYFESRSPQYIRPFINGFKGYLQTDEYPGYEAALKEHKILYPKDIIVHVACAAHIRRKFYDVLLNGKSKNSAIAIKYILITQ